MLSGARHLLLPVEEQLRSHNYWYQCEQLTAEFHMLV